MKKKSNWVDGLLWALVLSYLFYLVLRMLRIPMTQDEVATCYNHTSRAVWDILTYSKEAVPNNHILNTLCIKLLASIFGMGKVVARIPTFLIGGVLYTLTALAISKRLGKSWYLQVSFLILFLGNPFMAEFFALARGYGMGIGLMTTALYFSWLYVENKRVQNLAIATFAAGMAVWASFPVLYFYLPWLLLMGLFIWQMAAPAKIKHAKILAIGAAVFGLICFMPIYRMQADDQLHFWGTTGFFQETLWPLVKYSTMVHPYFDRYTTDILTGLVAAFSVGACAVALWRWCRQNWMLQADPLVFAGFLFAGTVTVNLLLAYLLDVPFLNPRTAIFYYPLFALLLAGAAVILWEKYKKWSLWFTLPLAVFALVNFDNNRNLKQSFEWQYDRGTIKVLNFISQAYKSENRTKPFTLDCNWLHQNSLSFHREFDDAPYAARITMPNHYHGNEPPRGNTDFYYTGMPEEILLLLENYEPVMAVESNRFVLMRRLKGADSHD